MMGVIIAFFQKNEFVKKTPKDLLSFGVFFLPNPMLGAG